MTDIVVPGTFTGNYTSRNRVPRPPMYTHGGSSFPRAVKLFGQGRRVSRASFQSLVPRSGSNLQIYHNTVDSCNLMIIVCVATQEYASLPMLV